MAKFRLGKGALWFKVHRGAMVLTVLLVIAGFATILLAYSQAGANNFVIIHAKLGLSIAVIALFQPLNAVTRPPVLDKCETESERSKRANWETVHKGLGYLVLMLSWANVVVGLNLPYMANSDMSALKVGSRARAQRRSGHVHFRSCTIRCALLRNGTCGINH